MSTIPNEATPKAKAEPEGESGIEAETGRGRAFGQIGEKAGRIADKAREYPRTAIAAGAAVAAGVAAGVAVGLRGRGGGSGKGKKGA